MYRHWKTEGWSNLMLLVLALVILANSAVIIGFQLMTTYTYDSIAEARAACADYNLLDVSGGPELSAALLAAPGRTTRLIVTQKHFLANRHSVVLDTEVERHYSETVKTDQGSVTVTLDGIREITGLSRKSSSLPVRFSTIQIRVPMSFLILNGLLLAVEILMAVLLHKLRNH